MQAPIVPDWLIEMIEGKAPAEKPGKPPILLKPQGGPPKPLSRRHRKGALLLGTGHKD